MAARNHEARGAQAPLCFENKLRAARGPPPSLAARTHALHVLQSDIDEGKNKLTPRFMSLTNTGNLPLQG